MYSFISRPTGMTSWSLCVYCTKEFPSVNLMTGEVNPRFQATLMLSQKSSLMLCLILVRRTVHMNWPLVKQVSAPFLILTTTFCCHRRVVTGAANSPFSSSCIWPILISTYGKQLWFLAPVLMHPGLRYCFEAQTL